VGQFQEFTPTVRSQQILSLCQEVLALVKRAEAQRFALAALDAPLRVLRARLADERLPPASPRQTPSPHAKVVESE
jgi:hypothetical protein